MDTVILIVVSVHIEGKKKDHVQEVSRNGVIEDHGCSDKKSDQHISK